METAAGTRANGRRAGRRPGVDAPSDGLGARLREARLGRALSQAELAVKAEVSPDAVTKAERGHRRPQPRTIRKLADALGVEVEYLTGAPEPLSAGEGSGRAQDGKD